MIQQKNASISLLLQRDENVNCFRGTTLLHSKGMHFRCQHILALSREPPSVTTLSFHGDRSTVSSAKLPQCLTPTGISLK